MLVSQAAQRRTWFANIGHRTLPKIWVSFLYGAYIPGECFLIDSNGKNENKTYHKGIIW